MRELKFRVWDITESKMIYFDGIFNTKPFTERSSFPQYESYPEDHEVRVMLFSGLKDVNFNDIYDGDVVKSPCFENSILVETSNVLNFILISMYYRDLTVIGNIFENPELLEESYDI